MRKLLIFFLFGCNLTFSQHSEKDVFAFQDELKKFYLNPEKTPLNADELAVFQGIQFYPYSEEYIVTAQVEYLYDQPTFLMASSGKIQQEYKRFAILHFYLKGKKYQLEAYQRVRQPNHSEDEISVFLPFLDETNGKTTAEIGRYIDVTITQGAQEITLNFNKSYHPYCAYTHGYSCPITPFVNSIDIQVKAGVKY